MAYIEIYYRVSSSLDYFYRKRKEWVRWKKMVTLHWWRPLWENLTHLFLFSANCLFFLCPRYKNDESSDPLLRKCGEHREQLTVTSLQLLHVPSSTHIPVSLIQLHPKVNTLKHFFFMKTLFQYTTMLLSWLIFFFLI